VQGLLSQLYIPTLNVLKNVSIVDFQNASLVDIPVDGKMLWYVSVLTACRGDDIVVGLRAIEIDLASSDVRYRK
jgi:hypothetical protein